MNRTLMSLLVLGALALPATAQQSEKSTFIKSSVLYVSEAYNNDQFVYNGGKTRGWGFELGYDYAMPDAFSFITPWIGYGRFVGNSRPEQGMVVDDHQFRHGLHPPFLRRARRRGRRGRRRSVPGLCGRPRTRPSRA